MTSCKEIIIFLTLRNNDFICTAIYSFRASGKKKKIKPWFDNYSALEKRNFNDISYYHEGIAKLFLFFVI